MEKLYNQRVSQPTLRITWLSIFKSSFHTHWHVRPVRHPISPTLSSPSPISPAGLTLCISSRRPPSHFPSLMLLRVPRVSDHRPPPSLWRPRFLISIISASDRISKVKCCWRWSNRGQPRSSPRKPSQQARMTLLITSTPTCGQPLVKTPIKTPMSLNSLQNFCRVLQISSKHFKIGQYKSCSSFRGTHFS
jgi:hypothetical protein